MSETPRVFVSHSHEDDAFCRRLIADLRSRLGEDAIWYDTSGGLHGSDDWWDRIIAEITERPYFLVVLSPNTSMSKWVPEEMKIAYRQHVELGKRLIPVRLAPSARRADWASIQEVDFTAHEDPSRYGGALEEVLQALRVDPSQPILQHASALQPDTPQDKLVVRLAQEAHTAYGRERWSDTLDRTDALIARQAMTPALWRERASAAYALGDPHAALRSIGNALHADPDDVETLRLQGHILLREGQTERAVEALTLANTLVPLDDATTRLPLLDDICTGLERLERWNDVLRRCGDALYLAPQDAGWMRRRLAALRNLNRYDDALETAQTIAALPEATREDAAMVLRLRAQPMLDQLSRQVADISLVLNQFRSYLMVEVGDRAKLIFRDLADQPKSWIVDFTPKNSIGLRFSREKRDALVEETIRYLASKASTQYDEWQQATLLPLVELALRDRLLPDIRKRIEFFDAGLDEMKLKLAGLDRETMASGDEKQVPLWQRVVGGVGGLLLGDVFSAGFGMAFGVKPMPIVDTHPLIGVQAFMEALIPTSAVQAFTRGNLEETWNIRLVAQEFAHYIDTSRDELAASVAKSVDDQMQPIQSKIEEILNAELASVREQVEGRAAPE